MIYDICISLIILSFVPIIVLSSEIVINYIFNTPKNTINMFEMLIYILLLICGIIVLFYFMKISRVFQIRLHIIELGLLVI